MFVKKQKRLAVEHTYFQNTGASIQQKWIENDSEQGAIQELGTER